MPRVIHVASTEDWDKYIAETKGGFGGKGAVVDFTASWCGPCKMIGPVFDKMSDEFPTVTFLKVDVDELQDVAQAVGIKAMPTFKAFFNGLEVKELVGGDQGKLRALIQDVESRTVQGSGRKLAEDNAPGGGADSAEDRRQRMAEAAEARMKAMQGSS